MKAQNRIHLGLLGRSLGHSFSKQYFTEKFVKERINAQYENYEIKEINQLKPKLLSDVLLRGFNITFPYKKAILPFLDFKDDTVRKTGACNTVLRTNNYLFGYNTDVKGFLELFKCLDLAANRGEALILGTGGAASAVSHAFNLLHWSYDLVSRTNNHDWSYARLTKEVLRKYNVIVQATPLGTRGALEKSYPLIPYEGVHQGHVCIDLNYNPEQTVFLGKCAQQGAETVNGMIMLKKQAEESWRIWNCCGQTLSENGNKI